MTLVHALTRWSIRILIFLVVIILLYSLAELIALTFRGMITHTAAFANSLEPVDRNHLFLREVQGLISAVLFMTILVELIISLIEYLKVGSANYVTVITEIALIAIVRHLLALDIEHVDASVLVGLSALILVLGLFYLAATQRLSMKWLSGEKPGTKEKTDTHA